MLNDDTRFLTNIPKTAKPLVLAAIEKSGQPVVWKDEPSDAMDTARRPDFGCIWGPNDSSAFWRAYREIEAAALAKGQQP